MMVRLKRIYDQSSPSDGYRVLVDRLWPRGLSKQSAKVDIWLKDIAPSTDLRKWFNHRPDRFHQFKATYMAELAANPLKDTLLDLVSVYPSLTLLYGAKDTQHNQAAVLRDFIMSKLG